MLSLKVFQKKAEWTNWAGNVKASPHYSYSPKNVSDVQEIIDSCRIRGQSLRVTGAAHSFSPIACPDNETMSLDHLSGLISYDSMAMEARLRAGTYLYDAVIQLGSVGMAFENMGDIQEQTIAGAVSTGTHGTGISLGSLSSQVVEWTWVDGYGQLRNHRRANDDLSKALSLSLGLLGVLVDVTIRTVPLYSLRAESCRYSYDDALTDWQDDVQTNRHLEWFYFPGTNTAQVKKTNIVPLVKQTRQSKAVDLVKNGLIETVAFKAISEICRVKPRMSRKMTAFSAKNVPIGIKEGIYYETLPSPRLVKFTEVEYAIPFNRFKECIEEIHTFLNAHPFYVHFPIECRTTTGEDAFLSPTQNEDSVFLAFHMYKGMDDGPFFKWVHKLMAGYGGRPHFGKKNDLTHGKLNRLYPNLHRFMDVRETNDPNGTFMNAYTRKLFMS
ncbi:D-arabinono-1,4-lactone oxidase [Sporosarcina siberiensis]|uniref:D-arabinono-1,4-lactone oxidase n=1 Tax=Sporosarcina siberiensis TaxID=1365606 RepID=A0ABW4SCY3_9BACL